MDDKFLSMNETCKLLKISMPTLSRLVALQKIPSYKIGSGRKGRRLFDREELIEWVKSHRNDKPKKPAGKKAKKGEKR